MNSQELVTRDLAVLWHPCTQMKDHEWLPMIPIKRGQGVYLEDYDGKRYIDAISSWWVNLFGHSNPRINQKIIKQVTNLEHVILAGFTHEPVIELSEKLVKLTPPGLSKCFYADNGSSAIEVAIKMSFHYWHNQNQAKKTKFVTLSNSYHGETLGALAVGNVELYKKIYGPLLMDTITVASPDCYDREPGESWESHSSKMFEPMREVLKNQHESIAAVIVEPLVQCAGGMRMYHPIYLTKLRALCDQYNVHLIADEIAVGFGRTGTLFACEQANISPDFMCLSKGLTGGYLPLAVTLTTEKVYNAFYGDYKNLNAFLHSHSYTGNALGCAAALATLEIFEQDQVIQNNQALSQALTTLLAPFKDHPHVAEIRQTGMIAAIEIVKDKKSKQVYDWQERRGLIVYQHGLDNGVLLRPLGNVIYFMPPYVITTDELQLVVKTAFEGIDLAVSN